MKIKLITLFALVFYMSAFLMPVNAYAADTAPPTVKARITDNMLTIEAKDTDSGVEAVFIDEQRFNYRVDSVIEVDAREYAGDGEKISIYAVDFMGNKSEVVLLDNPYYVAPTEPPISTPEPIETPTDTQSNPFTPSGQATVTDVASERDGKDFYTFTTPAGNVFYLIIDHQKNTDNVYFLNAITEDDLAAIAEKSDKKQSSSAIPTTEPTPTQTEKTTETETPAETEKTQEKSNSGMIIFIVLVLAAAGGAGYYFKILKPKQQAASDQLDDDYEDDGEEMEFEDEHEDYEDDSSYSESEMGEDE